MNVLARKTFGSRGLAARLWRIARDENGDEHPATRAALGRLYVHQGRVPDRYGVSPEAVAWRRESGADPGFYNRSHRKFLRGYAKRFAVDSRSSVSTVESP